ncbi:HEPN domain-containing protein [Actinokineospora sp. NBRC 105648]|uniref:HEPN domain-containing protein n=1 Tax=Actinokineospora sp. NBRC 105648 TaxID=3032206 RepID=UPI0024A453AA|nr:HEPN domain-containing protein [Actinokineospora sp. NBRC 105648]GLZ38369.1 hypothetical protein Acsp05_19930 [Actinokineospora sp. NBRC 105648]
MWTEYRELLSRIRKLSKEFLPKISPTASYRDDQVRQMFAFRLSAHAEMEGFLELCAQELATELAMKNSKGILSKTVAELIVEHKEKCDFPPMSVTKRPKDIQDRVNKALNKVQGEISQNNGVSEKDVLKLFVPLGIDIDGSWHPWLNSMNDVSQARGRVAHRSWVVGGSQIPTPQAERARLVGPLFGMRRLIEEIEVIRAVS